MSKILAIDAGNTRVKFALLEADSVVQSFGVASDRLDLDAFEEILSQVERPDGVILASVVRGAAAALSYAVNARFGLEVIVTDADSPMGIEVAVPEPNSVGVDRLIMSGAAYRLTQVSTVVVGVGTAITVDLVSSDRVYLGGTISPGLRTSAWALAELTSLLPEVDVSVDIRKQIPDNTISAIQDGLLIGGAGAVDRLVGELADRAKFDSFEVVLSGGDSRLLSGLLETPHKVHDDLVLTGLGWIYRQMEA